MARLKIKLTRNLRRSIQRGHPWVYRDALVPPPKTEKAQLAQILDAKGELAWAIYDPHGPLSLRILSTDKAPPVPAEFERRFAAAWSAREAVRGSRTNAYRLFNGEGDLLPGLICDVYADTAVIQFDGRGPSEFWDRELIAGWLTQNTGTKTVLEKNRRSDGDDRTVEVIAGETPESFVTTILENGARFEVNLEKGQKTGFFLDQRDNRDFVRTVAGGKSVLNLFSYTGGFSIYAGLGGASRVASADVSKGAIETAGRNWKLNGLAEGRHQGLTVDVFDYLREPGENWDHVIVDPPSMGHAEAGREIAKAKYADLFTIAAQRVNKGGQLSLSSCSSHVSFDDFFSIIEESLSRARRRGRIQRVSGQGADHPFPHACFELRYLKFVHLVL